MTEPRRLREIEERVLRLKAAGMTYPDVGETIGRTAVAARALRMKALRKLRNPAYKAQRAALLALLPEEER